jgi:two-component system LytT family sensor kinase
MKSNSASIRNYFIVYSIMWVMWMALHILILNNNGITIHAALTDSLISNILLFVFCIALSNILRFYQPGKNSSKYLLIWCVTLASSWLFLSQWVVSLFLGHDIAFMALFNATFLLRFVLANLFIGGSILLMWVWQNFKNQQEENLRHLQSLQLSRDAELAGLRQQLQPHFLFNSLNSISALAGSQPERARLMIQQLSDFLRGTLRKDEKDLVPLSEEIANVNLYLEIEKVRFGHRLNTKIEIEDTSGGLSIPPLLLQPIVENAIKFGLYDTLGDVTISIRARSQNNELLVEVENPYNPQGPGTSKGVGFGLNSLKRRLFLLYNRSDLMKTIMADSVFKCSVIIPQKI